MNALSQSATTADHDAPVTWKAGLLDFGLVKEFSPQLKHMVCWMVLKAVASDMGGTARGASLRLPYMSILCFETLTHLSSFFSSLAGLWQVFLMSSLQWVSNLPKEKAMS